MILLYGFIVILFVILLYVLATYNSLVSINNVVKEAFSTMDVYLKKRWDLVPNLVESVKGYVNYENETLTKITELRAGSYEQMNIGKKININEELTKGIETLLAVSENYPELKSSENFMQLSNELTKVEDDIANSRKYYN